VVVGEELESSIIIIACRRLAPAPIEMGSGNGVDDVGCVGLVNEKGSEMGAGGWGGFVSCRGVAVRCLRGRLAAVDWVEVEVVLKVDKPEGGGEGDDDGCSVAGWMLFEDCEFVQGSVSQCPMLKDTANKAKDSPCPWSDLTTARFSCLPPWKPTMVQCQLEWIF